MHTQMGAATYIEAHCQCGATIKVEGDPDFLSETWKDWVIAHTHNGFANQEIHVFIEKMR